MHHSEFKSDVRKLIAEGTVIPAHPLALDAGRALATVHQRALTRYYAVRTHSCDCRPGAAMEGSENSQETHAVSRP